MIHQYSLGRDNELIYLNYDALQGNIAESELFGHVKGAFTGATSHRPGRFELADKGTIFLDEIGELPIFIQAKLLRAIQFGDIQRVGSDKHLKVDVRIIAATNRNLIQAIKEGSFREDLYHRLCVFPIHVPPLRERKSDLEVLVGYFLERNTKAMKIKPARLGPGVIDKLKVYSWPGNIRELENVLNRVLLRTTWNSEDKALITLMPQDFDLPNDNSLYEGGTTSVITGTDESLAELTNAFQKSVILKRLKENNGNWSKTAESLELDKGNIHRLGKRLGIK